MNLFHLRYFETLARTEHYSKAAEILSITQPSLSYAISTLESELGIQLFEKRGRNIVLTKYGKAFYSNVKEILASLDNAVRDIKLVANGEGEINIGFLRTLGTDYVPTTVKNFLDLHPDKNIWFNFSCEHGLSVDLVRSLIDREYDMVFCSKLNNSPMVEFIPIATQELVVIVPKDHPLAVKDSVSLKETLDYPQIIFRHKSGLRHIIDDLFKSINAYPDILCEIGLEHAGAPGTTAALALLNDQVKKGGVMASSYVGGLSGAFIPVSEDQGMIDAVNAGALTIEKLEAMTCVCSVGLDMIAIPGETKATTISGIIADEMAIGMVNQKTTAVRVIPVIGKGVGETVEFGGLLGYAPIMPVNQFSCDVFVNRGGRIPAPIHSFKN